MNSRSKNSPIFLILSDLLNILTYFIILLYHNENLLSYFF